MYFIQPFAFESDIEAKLEIFLNNYIYILKVFWELKTVLSISLRIAVMTVPAGSLCFRFFDS